MIVGSIAVSLLLGIFEASGCGSEGAEAAQHGLDLVEQPTSDLRRILSGRTGASFFRETWPIGRAVTPSGGVSPSPSVC